ncbi:MAG: Sua5/YciO/YrdC/YwlC family protein [Bacteroidota bacterium]
MHHPLPPLGSRALSTLHAGGLVLLPTTNLWQLTAHVGKAAAINKLLQTCPQNIAGRPELVFADRETLWEWCPSIPPKLDTLLEYHKRPLTIISPAGRKVPLRLVDQRGEVAVRLAGDSFCYRLCEDIEAPLVSCLAMGPGAKEFPTSFGKIRSDVLQAATYTVMRRQREVIAPQPTVTARLKEDGELEFLRP